jgi:hypothetical protein
MSGGALSEEDLVALDTLVYSDVFLGDDKKNRQVGELINSARDSGSLPSSIGLVAGDDAWTGVTGYATSPDSLIHVVCHTSAT